ncbi:MAG: inorganic diphosphatase [Chitinophagales bacterium]
MNTFNNKRYFLFMLFFVFCFACNSSQKDTKNNTIDYDNIATYAKNKAVQAVIEIPAGTNHKMEYDKKAKKFVIDQRNGKDRVIDFLPYVGNYGFVPSTLMDESNGGDGDALDILVLSEALPSKTVVEVIPIAMLKLKDDGELDTKLIAVPFEADKRIVQATTFEEFSAKYPAAKQLISLWFLNYDKQDETEMLGWGTEIEAQAEIAKWTKNKK